MIDKSFNKVWQRWAKQRLAGNPWPTVDRKKVQQRKVLLRKARTSPETMTVKEAYGLEDYFHIAAEAGLREDIFVVVYALVWAWVDYWCSRWGRKMASATLKKAHERADKLKAKGGGECDEIIRKAEEAAMHWERVFDNPVAKESVYDESVQLVLGKVAVPGYAAKIENVVPWVGGTVLNVVKRQTNPWRTLDVVPESMATGRKDNGGDEDGKESNGKLELLFTDGGCGANNIIEGASAELAKWKEAAKRQLESRERVSEQTVALLVAEALLLWRGELGVYKVVSEVIGVIDEAVPSQRERQRAVAIVNALPTVVKEEFLSGCPQGDVLGKLLDHSPVNRHLADAIVAASLRLSCRRV